MIVKVMRQGSVVGKLDDFNDGLAELMQELHKRSLVHHARSA